MPGYMYSDEVNLSGSNVMGVLYLAKKYIVPSLADKCAEYLQENLNPSHRRTSRGGEGGCSPPKFWATQIFWAARENVGKASFQRRFRVFY